MRINQLTSKGVMTSYIVSGSEPLSCPVVEVEGFLRAKCTSSDDDSSNVFKCHNSDHTYTVTTTTTESSVSTVSAVCPLDFYWYQACGLSSQNTLLHNPLCAKFFCQEEEDGPIVLKPRVTARKVCQSSSTSSSSGQTVCPNISPDSEQYDLLCGRGGRGGEQCYTGSEDISLILDSLSSSSSSSTRCDGKCDCPMCEDEYQCDDHTQGMICHKVGDAATQIYLSYRSICNSVTECEGGEDEAGCECEGGEEEAGCECEGGEEEAGCEEGRVGECVGRDTEGNSVTVKLNTRNMCQIPNLDTPLCYHDTTLLTPRYLDQMNCTSTSSPIHCTVNSYPTTITSHLLCQDLNVCDDNLDSACLMLEGETCKVHKHQRCDGVSDCPGAEDEDPRFCR